MQQTYKGLACMDMLSGGNKGVGNRRLGVYKTWTYKTPPHGIVDTSILHREEGRKLLL